MDYLRMLEDDPNAEVQSFPKQGELEGKAGESELPPFSKVPKKLKHNKDWIRISSDEFINNPQFQSDEVHLDADKTDQSALAKFYMEEAKKASKNASKEELVSRSQELYANDMEEEDKKILGELSSKKPGFKLN